MCVHQRCGGHRQPSQDPEGNQRSAQRKQSPPHDLWRLPAAETRGLHILTIRAAFCSFSIKLTWSTLLVLVLFLSCIFSFTYHFLLPSSAWSHCASSVATPFQPELWPRFEQHREPPHPPTPTLSFFSFFLVFLW